MIHPDPTSARKDALDLYPSRHGQGRVIETRIGFLADQIRRALPSRQDHVIDDVPETPVRIEMACAEKRPVCDGHSPHGHTVIQLRQSDTGTWKGTCRNFVKYKISGFPSKRSPEPAEAFIVCAGKSCTEKCNTDGKHREKASAPDRRAIHLADPGTGLRTGNAGRLHSDTDIEQLSTLPHHCRVIVNAPKTSTYPSVLDADAQIHVKRFGKPCLVLERLGTRASPAEESPGVTANFRCRA